MKRVLKTTKKLSGQEIQDEIFRRMSADRKVEVGSQLWRLAKELVSDKIRYGTNRPKTFVGKSR